MSDEKVFHRMVGADLHVRPKVSCMYNLNAFRYIIYETCRGRIEPPIDLLSQPAILFSVNKKIA